MFEEFFDKCEIQYPETVTAEQSEKIKASLQKMVGENPQTKQPAKEGNIMKTKTIRTIVIAAAIAALGAVGVAGAADMGSLSVRKQISEELAEKNVVTEEFEKRHFQDDAVSFPLYEDMAEINKLIITEMEDSYFDILSYGFDLTRGIFLEHYEEGYGGISRIIVPDSSDGYMFLGDEGSIDDEKLLNAIAEGSEEYGDSFIIWY